MCSSKVIFILFLSVTVPLRSARILVYRTNDSFNDRLAAFGGNLNNPIDGFLIPVESLEEDRNSNLHKDNDSSLNAASETDTMSSYPSQGCSHYILPKDLINKTWIALVERGGCSFVEKIRNMQNSGASAVIVGDNEKGSGLITMYSNEPVDDIVIPSVFIRQWTYREIQFLSRPATGLSAKNAIGRRTKKDLESKYLLIKLMRSDEFQWPLLDIIIVTVIAPIVILLFLYSLWKFRRRSLASNSALGATNGSDMCSEEGKKAFPQD